MCSHSPVENGQIADPANWGVADVVNYFKATGFEEQATAFQDQVCVCVCVCACACACACARARACVCVWCINV